MNDLKIKALADTTIKRLTIDSTGLPDSQKFSLEQGGEIDINWFRSAPSNHWEFEIRIPRGSFFNWFAYKPHTEITGIDLGEQVDVTQQRMAFLDMIAWAEGTDRKLDDGVSKGYNIIFTFDTFSSFSDHPRRLKRSKSFASDAAGRYQFLSTTWDMCKQVLTLSDFSPSNQDKAAVYLIKRRKALDKVDAGDVRGACVELSWEWASLPFNQQGDGRHGQPTINFEKAEKLFEAAGGILSPQT